MFLERLFSSYEDVMEEEEAEEEPPFLVDGKPAAAVAPTPRPLTQERETASPWLEGMLPGEDRQTFFARRAGEASWEAAKEYFEGLHARMCHKLGPENVSEVWSRVRRFASIMEDHVDRELN